MGNQFTNPWTEEQNNILKDLVSEGFGNQQIADELNKSKRSVSMQKWRLGLKEDRSYLKYKNKNWLEEMYNNQGYSTTDIAKVVGLHHTTIARWMKELGVQARGFYEKSDRHREKIAKATSYRKGEKSSSWKGGKLKTDEGYVYLKVNNHPYANANGYVCEHRLVIERDIKRYLKPTEVVHHINGIKHDNRLENLFLFKTGGDHIKFHAMERKIGEGAEMKYEYK